MSQRLPSDFHIDPNSTNGTELADILNRWADARDSLNSGVARPSYAKRGTLWLDESGIAQGGKAELKMFDGANDTLVGTVDTNSSIFTVPQANIGDNVLINGANDLDRSINQRGIARWSEVNIGDYGFDRWYVVSGDADAIGHIAQIIEPTNLIDGETYTLSWDGGGDGQVYDSNGNTSGLGASPRTVTMGLGGQVIAGEGAQVPKGASNIKLEVGTVPTPFRPRNIQQELAMCQRFYQPIYVYVNMPSPANNGVYDYSINYPVEMRATPTIDSSGIDLKDAAAGGLKSATSSSARQYVLAESSGNTARASGIAILVAEL